MKGEQIRAKLHSGEPVFGTLVVSTSPHWLRAVEGIGLDFVFIDTEHIPIDRQTLAWMCQAYAARGLPPMVRITRPDPYEACAVLDGGACGIVVPYVETPQEVRELVGAVHYKPIKGRRLVDALEDPGRLDPGLRGYLAAQNANHFLAVNIESTPAVEALDDILGVDGLDGVLVGPHDLSCSLGIPERYTDPRFTAAVEGIIAKAAAAGVAVGIHAIAPALAEREVEWARLGARIIIHSADILAAKEKLTGDVAALREALGAAGDGEGQERPGGGAVNI